MDTATWLGLCKVCSEWWRGAAALQHRPAQHPTGRVQLLAWTAHPRACEALVTWGILPRSPLRLELLIVALDGRSSLGAVVEAVQQANIQNMTLLMDAAEARGRGGRAQDFGLVLWVR